MKMTLDSYIKDYATLGYSIKEFYADGQKVEAVLHNEVLYLPYSYPPKTIMVDIAKVAGKESKKKADKKFSLTNIKDNEVIFYQEGRVTFAIEKDFGMLYVAAAFAHPNDDYCEVEGKTVATNYLKEGYLLSDNAPDSYMRSEEGAKHLKMLKKLAKHNRCKLVS